ncbi:MAG TPA: LuxR C-terminal-related transcriptional regulator, partial [Chloroflexota bacterium]|nr:LuxR C-terminal-related transcriptional regulator [Chloroflexota bacterium]
RPTIVVFEDVHWADEATLDFLRFAGHRIGETTTLLVATYRDDEVGAIHPLRVLLGDLATCPDVRRLAVPALSEAAVRTLAAGSEVDPVLLHRRTGGNPFFVTEILASETTDLPATVLDAVLARASRLSKPAREVLEACAVVGSRIEAWLLDRMASPAVGAVGECLSRGMLHAEGQKLGFRHELARDAILHSLSPQKAHQLHSLILAALRASPVAESDPARLAHHAEAIGDASAVLEYAPEAAQRAAALGAHREAAAQYGRALRFGEGLPLAERAQLLERCSYECHLAGQQHGAIEAQERTVMCYSRLGDHRKHGDALRWLSRLLWFAGPIARANELGLEAVTLLERLAPGRELALAYANMAHLRLNTEDGDGAVAWANRGLDLAERLGDVETRAYALGTIGVIDFRHGDPSRLEQSLGLAQQAGLEYHVARAYASLAMTAVDIRSHANAARYIDEGIRYASERDLEAWRLRLLAIRASLVLDEGRWSEAADCALAVLRQSKASLLPGLPLMVLGLVRARRGEPEVWRVLDELRTLETGRGEFQGLWPLAAARAEAAWLAGRPHVIGEETGRAFTLALTAREPWPIGELAYWRWRAGIHEDIPTHAAEPYALQIAGEWQRAAELWTDIGCPYQAALALAESDDPSALRRALEVLERLSARPMAATITRRLRRMGIRDIPRGPRRATRASPAGLTERETEVLHLLAEGLPNADIACRLYLSPKTVQHHVSSVLSKLGAHRRGEAVTQALRRGLIAPSAGSRH